MELFLIILVPGRHTTGYSHTLPCIGGEGPHKKETPEENPAIRGLKLTSDHSGNPPEILVRQKGREGNGNKSGTVRRSFF